MGLQVPLVPGTSSMVWGRDHSPSIRLGTEGKARCVVSSDRKTDLMRNGQR